MGDSLGTSLSAIRYLQKRRGLSETGKDHCRGDQVRRNLPDSLVHGTEGDRVLTYVLGSS